MLKNAFNKGLAEGRSFSDTLLVQYLSEVGYDPVFGARPLKRAIQQHLENPLAQALLAGEFLPGQTIEADVQQDQVVFASA